MTVLSLLSMVLSKFSKPAKRLPLFTGTLAIRSAMEPFLRRLSGMLRLACCLNVGASLDYDRRGCLRAHDDDCTCSPGKNKHKYFQLAVMIISNLLPLELRPRLARCL